MFPTKEQIEELAREMYLTDQVKCGLPPITPTLEELKGSGYYEKARLALMRRRREPPEEKWKEDEINWAMELLEQNGYVVLPKDKYVEMAFIHVDGFTDDIFAIEQKIRILQLKLKRAMMEKYSSIAASRR